MKKVLFFLLAIFHMTIAYSQYTLTLQDVDFVDGVIKSYLNTTEKDIIIPDNFDGKPVVEIAYRAFYNKSLTSISLPNKLLRIGNQAFYYNSLSSLNIPKSVTTIYNSAFNRNKLSSVTFEENSNIQNIWSSAFASNSDLSSITLPTHASDKFTNYGDKEGRTYQPGDKVTDFSRFYYAHVPYTLTLDDVDFVDGVIKDYLNTIEKCIIIPESLGGQKVTSIGYRAFYENSLNSIVIPNTVTYIGNLAFDDCCLTSLSIPNSVVSIGSSAFYSNYLKSVTFEENSNIQNVWSSAFASNSDLSSITLPTHASDKFTNYGDKEGRTYQPGDKVTDFSRFYYAHVPYTLTLDDVDFVDGVIKDYLNTIEKCIIIPESLGGQKVTSIGYRAFYENSLNSIVIPNTVTYIGNLAFDDCCLTSLSIPNSVVSIGSSAFYSNYLKSVTFEENSNIQNVWSSAFASNSDLSSITLPTHASDKFTNYGDKEGRTYQPGDKVTDFSRFYYAHVPYTLTLDDVDFVDGVIKDYLNTIEKCIIIPESLGGQKVTSIGYRAFYENSLNSIVIPNTVTYIGNLAFDDCCLTSLSIPNSVVSIGSSAFYSNYLKSVTFEENSNIQNVWSSAFASNSDLSSITLPTHASDKFTNYGDKEGRTYQPGDKVTDFSRFYYAHVPYTLTLDDVDFVDGVIKDYLNTIEKCIIIPESLGGQKVTSIGYRAFYENSLNSIVIPNTVTYIGNLAFDDCCLTSLSIPNSVVSIGSSAFYSNYLKSVTFEENSNIRYIRSSAFASNSNLSSYTLPSQNNIADNEMYIDGYNNAYKSGEQITNFSLGIYRLFPVYNPLKLDLMEEVSSKINEYGEPTVFQFKGSVNDLLLVNDFSSNKSVQMTLYDGFYQPIKILESNKNAELDFTLEKNGTYYLIVTSLTNSSSVDFSFSFKVLPKYKILSYTPHNVGNYGKSTMVFEGNGFNSSTKIWLHKDGCDTLKYESLELDRFRCFALFNFNEKTKGQWDIFIDFGDTLVTIPQGLTIEDYKAPEVSIELIGRKSIRPNRYTTYTIRYKNHGNVNAYETPIAISVTGENESEIKPEWIPYIPVGFNKNDLKQSETFIDPETNEHTTFIVPTIPFIPPSGEGTFSFKVKMNKPMEIAATAGKPLFYSTPDGSIMPNDASFECLTGLAGITTDQLLDWGVEIAEDLIPGVGCATGIYGVGINTYSELSDNNGNISAPILGNLAWNTTKAVVGCATDFVPVTKAGKVAYGLVKAAMIAEKIKGYYDVAASCNEMFNSGSNNSIAARLVTSIDPNDKIGYRSPSGSNYFNDSITNFTYVINFENLSKATAPAQEVFITDTLDMEKFDINSFRAGYIKIGNKLVQTPTGISDYTWELDMRPELNLLTQVELTLDKEKGIAHWYFKCIDPLTNDFPEDPHVGFLPPNDSIGSGEGCVTFTIDLLEDVNEDEIRNGATIVFDYNKPIKTPIWSNKKDVVPPTSKMLSHEMLSGNNTLLKWEGQDNEGGSGVYCYNLFVKTQGTDYTQLLKDFSDNSFEFEFESGVEYSFYVTATDSAMNREIKTNVPDMVTVLTGINDIKTVDNIIVVYPNPSKAGQSFIVELKGLTNGILGISTIDGKQILTKEIETNNVEIKGLNSGIYIIRAILDDGKSYSSKLIVN